MMNQTIVLTGLGASPGIAEGVARVIIPGDTLGEFVEGEILVTTITDPTMVQAMVKAAGIVTNIGGITSHPAILSREMGIPCVVNTKDATTRIQSGTRLRLDGAKGEEGVLD